MEQGSASLRNAYNEIFSDFDKSCSFLNVSSNSLEDINDIHRKPERGIDSTGRKRFKTNKKIRDSVLAKANYLCDCNDSKHFYFESVELDNYVEGHHIVPMNRQQEYYFDNAF